MSQAIDPYDLAWEELRRRRRRAARPLVFVALATVTMLGLKLFWGEMPWLGVVVGLAVAVALALAFVALIRLFAFRCPRCGQRFHARSGDCCVQCGLHEFEAKELTRIDLTEDRPTHSSI